MHLAHRVPNRVVGMAKKVQVGGCEQGKLPGMSCILPLCIASNASLQCVAVAAGRSGGNCIRARSCVSPMYTKRPKPWPKNAWMLLPHGSISTLAH